MNNTGRLLTLFAIGLFTFMSVLDGSIVNVALPTMAQDMHIPLNQATWSVTIYLIVISGLLLFFGRLGDYYGKIKIFKIGTYVFTIGSLLAGMQFGLSFLLFARIIQAIGAAMTMSNSFGITTVTFPREQRARAMATVGMFVALGAIAGPAIGGAVLGILHQWSYIFWVNVPVGIIAILFGAKFFPKKEEANPGKIDWLGLISFFLVISIFFGAISAAQVIGFDNILVITLFVVSLIIFIIFLYLEKRNAEPMIQLSLFKNGLYSLSLTTGMLLFIANSYINTLMPFYLQNYRGFSAGNMSLILLSFPVTTFVLSPIVGYLADKYNKEIITLIGLTVLVVAQIGFLVFGQNTGVLFIVITLILNGAATAIFQAPNNALVMSAAPKKLLGIAGSVQALARNIGFVIGTTLSTTILFIAMSSTVGYRVTNYIDNRPEVFLNGMHFSFIIAAIISLVAFLMTLARVLSKKKLVPVD